MKFRKIIFTIITICIMPQAYLMQSDSLEIFIIDAFVTPEKPHTFNLSFFTSEEVKAKLEIDGKYFANISEDYLEDHSALVDFANYSFTNKFVPFNIICEKKNGELVKSETYEIVLPYEEFIETKEGDNPISTILIGLTLYLLPSPNLFIIGKENYFSLTKELPIITFYSSGYNYPQGNVSLEYTHIYEESIKNNLRLGYKHFIPISVFEYLSPGITGFTNFNGFNGVGAEISIGLFNFYDVFTVYSRYRYNLNPSETNQHFQEISIGLYSNFFTIDY
jgi:hypothetical protein